MNQGSLFFLVHRYRSYNLTSQTFQTFLQRSHQLDLEFSPRDGLHILQYAMKRLIQNKDHPIAKDIIWQESIQKVLGDDALDLDEMAEKKNRALGETQLPQGLGDFFFDEDSPIHPDR